MTGVEPEEMSCPQLDTQLLLPCKWPGLFWTTTFEQLFFLDLQAFDLFNSCRDEKSFLQDDLFKYCLFTFRLF